MNNIRVRVPASSANLGPAFDCLALALNLWNETEFTFAGDKLSIEIEGEGSQGLPRDESNRIFQAFKHVYEQAGQALPSGLQINCRNHVPLSSGLGSSAAAVLTGLLAANASLDSPFGKMRLLQMGADLEGHADNLAAALHGGLVLVVDDGGQFRVQQLPHQSLSSVFVLPEIESSTSAARAALPDQVPMADAVYNLGRTMLLVEAFRHGDLEMLGSAINDRLHQPYRLPLFPGTTEALEAANAAGAAACLSGAGPGLIAFVDEGREKSLTEVLRAPFAKRGINTRQYLLKSTSARAQVS